MPVVFLICYFYFKMLVFSVLVAANLIESNISYKGNIGEHVFRRSTEVIG